MKENEFLGMVTVGLRSEVVSIGLAETALSFGHLHSLIDTRISKFNNEHSFARVVRQTSRHSQASCSSPDDNLTRNKSEPRARKKAQRDLHSLLKNKVSHRFTLKFEELEWNVDIITLTQNWWTEEWIVQKYLKY